MSSIRLTAAIGVALLMSLPASQAHAAKKGLDATTLVQLKRISSPNVSPDGQTMFYSLRETDLAKDKGMSKTWRMDMNTGQSSPVFSGDDSGSGLTWSKDGKTVYFSRDVDGASQLFRMSANGKNATQMTNVEGGIGGFKLSADAKHMVFSTSGWPECSTIACSLKKDKANEAKKDTGVVYDKMFVRHWDTWKDGKINRIYSLALTDKGISKATPVLLSHVIGDVPSKPWGGMGDVTLAPDGQSVVFTARKADRTEPWSTNFDLYRVGMDGKNQTNLTAANKAWDTAPTFSKDGKTLYYGAMKRPGFEADRFGIMAMDMATGKIREIAPNWDRSAGGLVLSEDGKTIYTAANEMGRKRLFAVDVASGAVKALTQEGYVGGFVQAGDRIIASVDDLDSPADLWSIPLDGSQAKQLTHVNADVTKNIAWGEYEQFTFKGANNEDVRGYVMKPANYVPGKKYPVAFLIHGGPQGSFGDHFHYRWNPQTYAGMGFASVFIDFHGSTGYGQDFTDSISEDWGGKPLEDLQKGWAYAQKKYDFLDADRACALGASYGGYMVNWIAGNWNEPWKCLVNHDGVFDQRMMYYATEELWFIEWENGGVYWDNVKQFEKHNPVNHVKDWKVPMLVVQGELDYRIPVTQSLATFTALQRQGIPSKLLYFPDENHWVLKPNNSIRWHQEVGDWLQQWTKPKQ